MQETIKNPFVLQCVLCSLLVPLLVTGPFLSDLLLSLLSLWFLYYSLKNKIYSIFANNYFYFFIVFWIVCVFSSLLSENVLFSLKASFFYVRIGIFSILISFLISQNSNILKYFFYSLIITFSFLIVDLYIQYFLGYNLLGNDFFYEEYRASSFFGDEMILGSYLVRLYPLFLALFFVRENKKLWEYYLLFVFFIFIVGGIIVSGERAALFFLILSLIFLFIFLNINKKIKLFLLIITISFITILFFSDNKFKDRFINIPIESMGLKNSNKFIFSPEHHSLFKTAWNMFLDKPILGHGPKMFRIKCKIYDDGGEHPCDTHPHNFYIQLLAEVGLIGCSFLIGLFFYFTYLVTKCFLIYARYKKYFFTNYQICLLAGLLITIWPFTSNGNFFTNYLMMFYGLQIGFFLKKNNN